jgi:predicted RNA-binding Zn-ribbon protein involved in translation (DUF1610 family)
MAYTQSQQLTSNAPPVSQPLVPEGIFALKLVTALKLGTASSEAQAEDMLTSVGIAPKNGWIADYPMTPITIGDDVWIGPYSIIMKGVTIGNNSVVGAGSVVRQQVPPNSLVYGNPARVQGWVCECGVKLQGEDKMTCPECGSTRLMRDYECAEIVCMDCGFRGGSQNSG